MGEGGGGGELEFGVYQTHKFYIWVTKYIKKFSLKNFTHSSLSATFK